MSGRKTERSAEITRMIDAVKSHLSGDINTSSIEAAKGELLQLCVRGDLFTFDDFPLPTEGSHEQTYLVHCDDDGGYALYVNAGTPGQSYRAHTHGNAWAIVGGVQGEETHYMYEATGKESDPISHKATLKVEPGTAVSILPDGFHAISAQGSEPLLHLHLYGQRFENQGTRVEFDEETGRLDSVNLYDFSTIIDAR